MPICPAWVFLLFLCKAPPVENLVWLIPSTCDSLMAGGGRPVLFWVLVLVVGACESGTVVWAGLCFTHHHHQKILLGFRWDMKRIKPAVARSR